MKDIHTTKKAFVSENTPSVASKTSAEITTTKEQGVIRRIEKITAAVYMVTDLLDTADPLVQKIHVSTVAMLSRALNLKNIVTPELVQDLRHAIENTISYLSVLSRVQKISAMNYQVINEQCNVVLKDISNISVAADGASSGELRIPSEFFEIQSLQTDLTGESEITRTKKTPDQPTIDHHKNTPEKKSPDAVAGDTPQHNLVQKDIATMSHRGGSQTSGVTTIPRVSHHKKKPAPTKNNDAKQARHTRILDLLRGKTDVSITDICDSFVDCSSKTIQRDLGELIENNQVAKKGSRRWSTYSLA